MRVLVVAEYYPRAADPVLGVWAHRQTLAARDAGADVRVIVLHRPLPALATLRRPLLAALTPATRQPAHAVLDGVHVDYVRYLSPPRPWSYGAWGLWAAPALAVALRRVRRQFPFDLVHAHYAVPAGDAVRRVIPRAPLVVSVHGGDLHGASQRWLGGRAVRDTLAHARLVLANSAGTARRCSERGARVTRVVHLGADLPPEPPPPGAGGETPDRDHLPDSHQPPTLVTVGHLIERKRHVDVIAAVAQLRPRHPELRYVIIGDGPERERLQARAGSLGVADMIEFRGQLAPAEAAACARRASVFALPSVAEAFGVAYIEAMAAGVPAIGCRGEDGPEELVAAGGGIALVGPGDVEGLARQIDALLGDPGARAALGAAARATVEREFTWAKCGAATVRAYTEALSAHPGQLGFA